GRRAGRFFLRREGGPCGCVGARFGPPRCAEPPRRPCRRRPSLPRIPTLSRAPRVSPLFVAHVRRARAFDADRDKATRPPDRLRSLLRRTEPPGLLASFARWHCRPQAHKQKGERESRDP